MAPIPIEDKFRDLCPPVSAIMVIGDHMKYLSAFITFKTAMADPQSEPTTELSDEAKLYFK